MAEIKEWTKHVKVERQARQQLENIASMDIIYKHIAVMPDVHMGKGATVGSVIPTVNAIIPAAVGVDIGCGMCAVKTNIKAHTLPDNLRSIRNSIEELIPVGQKDYGDDYPKLAEKLYKQLHDSYNILEYRHPSIGGKRSNISQMGTLGGGNHFIEVCLDEDNHVWIMLHSGSRGVGNRIGQYFINQAKMETTRHHRNVPDRDLSYIVEGSELFNDYVAALEWAQTYARLNRDVMMQRVLTIFHELYEDLTTDEVAVNCHHNYVQKEMHFDNNVWVTRKGAVSAKLGELGIIPGSMGAKSFIVRGLGNADSFHSCSHGAGRVMSRTKAKEMFTRKDHEQATKGVECRKDQGVIDETPMAYKDIDDVMRSQTDLVEIVHTLKQIVCVKG